VACGSSDTGGTGTGSSGGQGLLSGTWSYTATGSTGDTVCSITGAVLSLTSAGPNVTGTFSNANISCTNTTISFTASDSVTNGVYSALSLAFDLDTGGIILHNTGKANSALTAMSGIVVVKYLGDSILTGTWSATRTGN
jgi:hypothetical protein